MTIKKKLSVLMIIVIIINVFIPQYTKAEAVPEEPPEMPEWFKEKYCQNKSQTECTDSINSEFKGKEIKEIRKPKKVPNNITPVGIFAYILTEYTFSDTLQPIEQSLLEKLDYIDQKAWEYLDSVGLGSWSDIVETINDSSIYLKNEFVTAYNEFLDMLRNNDDITDLTDKTLLLRHEFPYVWQGIQKYVQSRDYLYIPPVTDIQIIDYFFTHHTTLGIDQYEFHYIMSVTHNGGTDIRHNYVTRDSFIRMSSDYAGQHHGVHIYDDETLNEHLDRFWQSTPGRVELSSDKFLQGLNVDPFYLPNYLGVENTQIPNPFGAHLTDPEDLQSIVGTEFGIVEIDNTKYYINNIPNPNHTPELPPNSPDYVPETYPVIRPTSTPNIEIPLIPEITPNAEPNPNPEPDPETNPEPDPEGNPWTPPTIPGAPGEEFGEGKGCKDLDLELKSLDIFTHKFPFSIPWDVFRATEALFGKMGDEEPIFELSFLPGSPEMKLPDVFKEWVPLLRTIILFVFDVSIIYALYRWFKGAS